MSKQKPIIAGKTPFKDLHTCLGIDSVENLEQRRARLFPTDKGTNEVPTTSTFLSSLCAIKEYRELTFPR
ncbi:MAG: hypothetical protein ABNH02_04120 [Pseudomonadales bacterium]|jgi:hypothetical protein